MSGICSTHQVHSVECRACNVHIVGLTARQAYVRGLREGLEEAAELCRHLGEMDHERFGVDAAGAVLGCADAIDARVIALLESLR